MLDDPGLDLNSRLLERSRDCIASSRLSLRLVEETLDRTNWRLAQSSELISRSDRALKSYGPLGSPGKRPPFETGKPRPHEGGSADSSTVRVGSKTIPGTMTGDDDWAA